MIALVGQSVLDRVTESGGDPVERLGGAPFFGAHALALCGGSAVIVTRGGDDQLRRDLHRFGFPVVVGPASQTILSVMDCYPDGTRWEATLQLGDPFTPHDVRTWMASALAGKVAVVCGAQWRGDFPPETLAELNGLGLAVYLDGQGAARPSRLGELSLEGPLDPGWVEGVSVLKLAEEEAEVLLGGIDGRAAEATGVPVVVVTRGHRDALLLCDGRVTPIPVDPIFDLADSIGAGDAFLALMAYQAAAGASPYEAACRACSGVTEMLRARLVSLRAGHA